MIKETWVYKFYSLNDYYNQGRNNEKNSTIFDTIFKLLSYSVILLVQNSSCSSFRFHFPILRVEFSSWTLVTELVNIVFDSLFLV